MGACHLPAGGGQLLPCRWLATVVDKVGCTFVVLRQFRPAALLQWLLRLVLDVADCTFEMPRQLLTVVLLPVIMPPLLLQLMLSPPMWLPFALPMH